MALLGRRHPRGGLSAVPRRPPTSVHAQAQVAVWARGGLASVTAMSTEKKPRPFCARLGQALGPTSLPAVTVS